ncbi:MAG: AAA family ATPase [Bacilli bacterium]|nr:AAA family ATPase [Bacilli bacterium]
MGQLQDRYKTLDLVSKKDSLFVIDRDEKPNMSIFDREWETADFAGDKTTNKLVIIDMLKDMDLGISYDINDFQDVAQKLMPKLRELCEKYNITILFTHHLYKRNKTLGSTAFDACIDGKTTLFETRNDHNHLIMNRDFSGFEINLKRNENQTFKISNLVEDDELDENLIFFIKYASLKKDFEFTPTSIIHDAKLKTTALRFERMLNANMDLLQREEIYITKNRTSDQRLSVTKQAVTHGSENSTHYELTKPKTQKSNRILPIAEILFRDLKQLYEEQKHLLILMIIGLSLEDSFLLFFIKCGTKR